jgi:hypothetical protein
MLKPLRARLTYANVMSTIAVFTALGGASYAAIRLPAGSVGTAQLRRHAVTLVKLNPGAVAALRGQPGQPGQPGPPGPQGAAGTAVAYGQVAADGTLSDSAGNPTVTRISTGRYCISVPGVDPSTTRLEATLGGGSVDPNAASPFETAGNGTSGCPAGAFEIDNGVLVVVTSGASPVIGFNPADEPFFFEVP